MVGVIEVFDTAVGVIEAGVIAVGVIEVGVVEVVVLICFKKLVPIIKDAQAKFTTTYTLAEVFFLNIISFIHPLAIASQIMCVYK